MIRQGSTNAIVTGNEVYHTGHHGITAAHCSTVLIQDNYVHDTWSHGISAGDPDDVRTVSGVDILDNRVEGTGSWMTVPITRVGVYIEALSTDILVRGNRIWDCWGSGLFWFSSSSGPVYFYHNSLYNNNLYNGEVWSASIHGIDVASQRSPVVRFKNNIVYNTQAGRTIHIEADAGANLDADYNLYYDSSGTEDMRRAGVTYANYAAYQAAPFEANSVISDNPDYTNPGGADFTLQVPASPALDAGLDIGNPFFGAAPDIGYWEFWGDPPPTEPSEGTGVMVG